MRSIFNPALPVRALFLALAASSLGCTAENLDYIPPPDNPSGTDGGVVILPDGAVLQLDGARPPDLTNPITYTPPYTPSHVGAGYFDKGNSDLVVTSSIDTDALTIDGQPAPAGTVFVADSGLAILATRSFTVPGKGRVRVTGGHPLVVVAREKIDISGLLDGGGHLDVPGPAGAGPAHGLGAGTNGSGSPLDGGGSGGGHGASGGGAGSVSGPNCGQKDTPRNPGGMAYGDVTLTTLHGGSGGGSGSLGGQGCPNGSDCHGGGGGGAIQLSAGTTLRVSGLITVSGGGGKGGCKNQNQVDSGSGGGGGSGGSLLLEAIALDLGGGVVAANGGGGGGGAYETGGGNGSDGTTSSSPASGGAGGTLRNNEVKDQRGGLGGTGGAGGASPDAVSGCGNSGGGGGAAGRIYLRSKMPITQAGLISPPAATGIIP